MGLPRPPLVRFRLYAAQFWAEGSPLGALQRRDLEGAACEGGLER